ncbi:MAG: DUF2971 domain-containing protein [Immundisolibacteraceae bacterium]|nr:DUF2971 domain-containing protein [Immundisolibacteraceae bacterium]
MFLEDHVIYRYKYLPFTEGSLKTLTEGTIKFTCPLDFNDPFDCQPFYDLEAINNLPNMRPDLFKAAGDRRALSPAKRLAKKNEFIARTRNSIEDGTFARGLLGSLGLVSLSRTALSIPMWSHYAQHHEGFVLEFRIPVMGISNEDSLIAFDRLLPYPVQYSKERPVIKIGVPYPDDFLEKLVLTKSTDWKYEEEERVLYKNREPGVYPYRRDEILCSVLSGSKIRKENRDQLTQIVEQIAHSNHNDLRLYEVKNHRHTYGLEIPDHPRLGLKQCP